VEIFDVLGQGRRQIAEDADGCGEILNLLALGGAATQVAKRVGHVA